MQFYLDARELSQENLKRILNLDFFDVIVANERAIFPENTQSTILRISETNDVLNQDDKIIGRVLTINTPEDMKASLQNPEDNDNEILIVETGDWHIIPLENLIAKYDTSPVQIITSARTPEEVKLLGAILEKGVDGCLLVPSEQYSVEVLINSVVKKNKVFDLEELTISSIKKIGLGDRVCVDTCSILHSGEGLLVGSTAAVFILIEAEVLETGFVNARPFRVNAGVVASYVLVEDKTQYLSEFQAGSDVMIVN
ncbi:MAG: 3-dehydroquinate synthase II, partial [Candidatus Kariarchaeaceae archaeon]